MAAARSWIGPHMSTEEKYEQGGRMAEQSVAVVGGRVVPVTGEPIGGGLVLLSGNRIEAVGDGGRDLHGHRRGAVVR
jgi:hypothetical protein